MKITEHIDTIQHEGQLLAAAATRTGLDAPIPTCPDWRMRETLNKNLYKSDHLTAPKSV